LPEAFDAVEDEIQPELELLALVAARLAELSDNLDEVCRVPELGHRS